MTATGASAAAEDTAEVVGAAIAGLVPAGVRTAVAAVGGHPSPFPAEDAAVAAASPARRAEFLAGRACAHRVLAALRVPDAPVRAGAAREPLWPDGVVGSITHTRSIAAAAAAHAGDAWAVGLDVEAVGRGLDARLRERLFTPAEVGRLVAAEAVEPASALVLFSAKESVFKCLFPRTRWRLRFHDVEVRLDVRERRFGAVVAPRFPSGTGPAAAILHGAFAVVAGHVVTAIAI